MSTAGSPQTPSSGPGGSGGRSTPSSRYQRRQAAAQARGYRSYWYERKARGNYQRTTGRRAPAGEGSDVLAGRMRKDGVPWDVIKDSFFPKGYEPDRDDWTLLFSR